ncbi:hypothetical protein BSKO_08636 [Bryopsis sp. KO-2023]|nr:hypothetical protein BSKO_08636 [Bryopsis sp. KO-2023]
MSSAVEGSKCSFISDVAVSNEDFEFSDTEEDMELAKALEEFDSDDNMQSDTLTVGEISMTNLKGLCREAELMMEDDNLWSIKCEMMETSVSDELVPPASTSQQLPLHSVPPDVVLKVLSCLSAADLSRLGQVSHGFRRVSSDNSLWRRLYCARWGHPGEDRISRKMSWKVLYFERERAETEEILERSPIESAAIFIEMQKAKRSTVLGVCPSDELYKDNDETIAAKKIAAWLKQNGFPESPVPRPAGTPGPFIKITNDAYVCEHSGWVHLCDRENCSERVVDPMSGQLVCPVSGRTFERWMSMGEERRLMDVDRMDESNEDFSISGRLGRAYAEGYYCANESELRRFCGVQLR